MQVVHVAVQDMQNAFVVQVDTVQDAVWLLARLSHVFVFKSAGDIQLAVGGVQYTFEIPAQPWLNCERLRELLARIPRVELIAVPLAAARTIQTAAAL